MLIKQKKTGFTLIELLIYIGILSLFLVGVIRVTWDVVYVRERSNQQQVLQQELRLIQARIKTILAEAQTVSSVSGSNLSLDNAAFSLVNGRLQVVYAGQTRYLSSNEIYLESLSFTQETDSADSQIIGIELQVRPNLAATAKYYDLESELSFSYELQADFSQARKLLIDAINAELDDTGELIEGILLSNLANTDIIFDKMNVSWTGATGMNLTEVQIDGAAKEWSGSAGSGTEIDLDNYTLSVDDEDVNLDYLEFDQVLNDVDVEIEFILADGSVRNLSLLIAGSSLTPTPTLGGPTLTPTPTLVGPTLTPTPVITTCADYCIFQGFSGGVCRQNARKCSQNGETYSSAGSAYCTGGASADSCCCQ